MISITNLPAKELAPGFTARLLHGAQSTISFVSAVKGSRIPLHHHPQEQTTHIVSGELEMEIGGEQFLFTAGSVHVIPSNVPHNAYAITDCVIIDFFSPARDDYR